MNKLPAFQFYPADWRKDTGVQSLSYHDRGIWFEILCLMHESEERGKLTLNGQEMPEEALARILGLDKQILTTTIATLLTYGVASRDEETGALVCRRMVRDEKLRKVRAEAGKMGGNPLLVKQKQTTPPNQILTPSSSSSSSSSSSLSSEAIASSESRESRSDSLSLNQDPHAGEVEKVKPKRRTEVVDEEWLEELQQREAYRDLPVRMLYAKMVTWCEVRRKQPTRARFVNWLNREERPMVAAAPERWTTPNTINNRAAFEQAGREIAEMFGLEGSNGRK